MDINWNEAFAIFFAVICTHIVWLCVFFWATREKPIRVAQTTVYCNKCSYRVTGNQNTFDMTRAMAMMDDHYKVHDFFGDSDHKE